MLLPFAGIWNNMVKRQKLSRGSREVSISADLTDGVTISEGVLIYKMDSKLKVYSAKCTHLGCLIEKEDKGEFVCPCHGSRYSVFDGSVKQGPSIKPLKELDYILNESGDQYIIYIDS